MSNPEKVVLILVGLVGSGKLNRDSELFFRAPLRQPLRVIFHVNGAGATKTILEIGHKWKFLQKTHYGKVFQFVLIEQTLTKGMRLETATKFARDLSVPSANEGFHCMVSLEPVDTKVEYSDSDIVTILDRVRSSEAVMQSRPKPIRISWAERRGQSRGGPTRDIKTQSNYLSRAWQQGTVFPTQNTSSSIQPATEVDGDIGVQAGHTHGEVSPLLKDLLGVD
ncbi:hypothetical protein HHX47_DHR6000751 [Lentinula edodes]|nr:hypothetical protein HHX47_DHR6000751 [Lentinula edodes]